MAKRTTTRRRANPTAPKASVRHALDELRETRIEAGQEGFAFDPSQFLIKYFDEHDLWSNFFGEVRNGPGDLRGISLPKCVSKGGKSRGLDTKGYAYAAWMEGIVRYLQHSDIRDDGFIAGNLLVHHICEVGKPVRRANPSTPKRYILALAGFTGQWKFTVVSPDPDRKGKALQEYPSDPSVSKARAQFNTYIKRPLPDSQIPVNVVGVGQESWTTLASLKDHIEALNANAYGRSANPVRASRALKVPRRSTKATIWWSGRQANPADSELTIHTGYVRCSASGETCWSHTLADAERLLAPEYKNRRYTVGKRVFVDFQKAVAYAAQRHPRFRSRLVRPEGSDDVIWFRPSEVDEWMAAAKMPSRPRAKNPTDKKALMNNRSRNSSLRPIHEIARDIKREWGQKVHYSARPYLDAMQRLGTVQDMYGADDGRSIVLYFLNNASTFRGGNATALKAELKEHLKGRSRNPGVRATGPAHLSVCRDFVTPRMGNPRRPSRELTDDDRIGLEMIRNPEPLGRRVAKQMEAAAEMGLTHDDIRAVVARHPERYEHLAVALGVELPLSTLALFPEDSPVWGQAKRATNPSAGRRKANPAPAHASARDLVLTIENDGEYSPDASRGQGRAVLKNQIRHKQKGNWSMVDSIKGWQHLVDAAAKHYNRVYGPTYNLEARRLAARAMAESFDKSYHAGEFDYLREKR